MKASFRLTPRAYEDLKSISRYSLQKWGAEQQKQYLLTMEERFYWLAENPQAGRARFDVGEAYFSFPQGRHIIFYLIQANGIDIIGVPHQQMDVVNYFG